MQVAVSFNAKLVQKYLFSYRSYRICRYLDYEIFLFSNVFFVNFIGTELIVVLIWKLIINLEKWVQTNIFKYYCYEGEFVSDVVKNQCHNMTSTYWFVLHPKIFFLIYSWQTRFKRFYNSVSTFVMTLTRQVRLHNDSGHFLWSEDAIVQLVSC